MARTVAERRPDGVVRLRRIERWRWVWLALAGLAVVGPLLLSIAILLPPVVFALPPMALWLIIWNVFRRLDLPSQPEARARRRRRRGGDVIPIARRAP